MPDCKEPADMAGFFFVARLAPQLAPNSTKRAGINEYKEDRTPLATPTKQDS
jgi:hypothetical protein